MKILLCLIVLLLDAANLQIFRQDASSSSASSAQSAFLSAQAVTILRQSVEAMGGSAPTDSSAAGTVTIVEGSSTQTGSIQILTRGTSQTSEEISLPSVQRAVIYSSGHAKEVSATSDPDLPLELAVTDQCPDFPLPLLIGLLNNPDEAFVYVDQETLNGTPVHHLQVWNTFASKSRLRKLAPFSAKDIWIDAATSVPLKIAYSRKAAIGSAPSVPVEIFFLSYKNISGIIYPFQINKSYNGTPWQTITIQNVSLNTGLTDVPFQTE